MVMHIGTLRAPRGAHKRRKRIGAGMGSGHGKTATRGSKGQRSRRGSHMRPGFEGGQMPLQRRIPKRGFTNAPFKVRYDIVNIRFLEQWFESLCHQPGGYLAAVEQIAAMDYEVDLSVKGRFQGEPGVGKEIGPAPPLLYPRSRRQIEPEMGVGKQEHLGHRNSLQPRVRLRLRARFRIPSETPRPNAMTQRRSGMVIDGET